MAYNHAKENERFKKNWAKEEIILKEAGMPEEAIKELYEFDLMTFKSNRRFRLHNCSFAEYEEKDIDAYEKSPMMKRFREALSTEMEISFSMNRSFGWIDEMDGEWLTYALRSLSEEEKEVLTLLMEEEFSRNEVAKKLGKVPTWVTWKKKAIREKLERARSIANHTS